MYVKVLLWLSLANIVKKINAQSSTCGQPTPAYGSTIIHPLQQNQHNSGSVVLFGCKEGFYLVGMPIIRCTGSTWTTIKFRCLGFCPEIRNILNGQVVHVTPKVGQAAVRFHCNKTHRLIGKPRLECINGRWNGTLPFCQKLKSCAPLSTPANGTLHGSDTSHGAKALFSCLTGFDLFGSPTLTCSNGVWNAVTPTCKAQCQKITDPLNGRKYGTLFSHGAIASFECNVGYELVGSRSLLCVVGKWNASLPVCNAMLCPRPSIPPNSYIIYPGIKDNYVHGIKLFLGCRNGYYLTGSPIMDCNQTVWSKVEFRCIAECPVLGQLKNGIITLVTLRNGGEVEIKCLTNYTLDGSSKIFCRNGIWSDSLPICGAPCSEPVTPQHGRRLGRDFMHGHSARFYCNRGYHRVGASSITCNDGKWDKQLPLCKAQCSDPGSPVHGRRRGNIFRHNSWVQFLCDVHYMLHGEEWIQCIDGSWSALLPKCIGICGRPRTLHGVRLHGNSYLDGDRVTFSCDKNLELFGNAELRCVGRAWDSPVPECKGRCTFDGTPLNGRTLNRFLVKGSTLQHNSIVEYSCDSFYKLTGSKVLRCKDGRWNATTPSCKASCGNPGLIDRGGRTGKDFSHGQIVTYHCMQGYSLEGSQKLTCDNGLWDSAPPQCKASCVPLQAPRDGKIQNNDIKHGALVSFSCSDGFQTNGSRILQCINGKWNGSAPTCKECGRALGMENYNIKDSRITSPARHYFLRPPRHARLNGRYSWCAGAETYLQIDLSRTFKVTSIATQGGRMDTGGKWVKQYKVAFYAGATRVMYSESGLEKSIQGNRDAFSVVKYQLKEPFVTRYLRIYPGWQFQSFCLRVEIYGCNPNPECILPGSMFWGLWSRKDNSLNYYKAFITRITASHLNFLLQINNNQRRSYKRTEPVLVIDKIPEMKEISVNSSVIAVHRPDRPEFFRAGNVTGTNERLSFVTVRFKNGHQRWVLANQLRLVKRPKFCVDSL